jgi:hypothetical protein
VTPSEVAKSFAAKLFKERGNHSEIHLSRAELEGLFEVVAELAIHLKVEVPKEKLRG